MFPQQDRFVPHAYNYSMLAAFDIETKINLTGVEYQDSEKSKLEILHPVKEIIQRKMSLTLLENWMCFESNLPFLCLVSDFT